MGKFNRFRFIDTNLKNLSCDYVGMITKDIIQNMIKIDSYHTILEISKKVKIRYSIIPQHLKIWGKIKKLQERKIDF